MPDLVPGEEAGQVAQSVVLLDEFLDRERALLASPQTNGSVFVHLHCHQKALVGPAPLRRVLQAAGFSVVEYEISMAIGERQLLPTIRDLPPEVPVVAMGISCRQQIAHGARRRALHLAELLWQRQQEEATEGR